jgi:hypothetical protein
MLFREHDKKLKNLYKTWQILCEKIEPQDEEGYEDFIEKTLVWP